MRVGGPFVAIARGVFRCVILVGPVAVKLPRLTNLLAGMRCNRWEREVWRVWRPHFDWSHLCPVIASDPLGLVVLMPRASQPVTQAEVDAADVGQPGCDAECKPDDWGRLSGRVVAVDYGLGDEAQAASRRAYYREQSAG